MSAGIVRVEDVIRYIADQYTKHKMLVPYWLKAGDVPRADAVEVVRCGCCEWWRCNQNTDNSDEWATPQEMFDELNKEFNFNLDPCATEDNAKCENFYTLQENGLEQSWGGYSVFVNPPYSEIGKWVEKCYREGCKDNTTVVLLIPSRTDTKYFHNFIYQRCELRFVKGRLKFGDGKGTAPFPSMIAIFRGAYV